MACEHEATFAVRRLCNEQWCTTANSQVTQQDISGQRYQIVEDALKMVSREGSFSHIWDVLIAVDQQVGFLLESGMNF